MAQRTTWLGIAIALTFSAVLGCAAPERAITHPAHSPRAVDAALDDWVGGERQGEAASRAGTASRTLAPAATGATTIHAPPEAPPRPRRTRVDVRFSRAEIGNALQFLADAGRFNLVLESGLSGQVSATLRDVDAYDALVMLAQANGAEVRYERQIVLVRHR